jgi:hypothetical protein
MKRGDAVASENIGGARCGAAGRNGPQDVDHRTYGVPLRDRSEPGCCRFATSAMAADAEMKPRY